MKRPKKRKTLPRGEVVRRAEIIVQALQHEVFEALRVEASLRAASDWILKEKPKETEASAGYRVLFTALSRDLALCVARLYDIGRKWPVNTQSKSSVPILIHFLGQKRCRSALILKVRDGFRPRMADRSEQTATQAVDKAVGNYRALMRSTAKRRRLISVRTLRDRRIAHNLFDTPPLQMPQYRDLFELIDAALEIVEEACQAVYGHPALLREAKETYRKQAEAFWRPALRATLSPGAETHGQS
jgi:hypothetical protein